MLDANSKLYGYFEGKSKVITSTEDINIMCSMCLKSNVLFLNLDS